MRGEETKGRGGRSGRGVAARRGPPRPLVFRTGDSPTACAAVRRFWRWISDRGRAERRLALLVQNSSDVIAVVRADARITYVSPAITGVIGRGPGERVGRSAFDMIHPEDVAGVRADFAGLLRRPGGTKTGKFRLVRDDGKVRRVEAIATNRLGEPDVDGVVINYRDVTGCGRAEEAGFRLASIVEFSEDAIASSDLRGVITSWNPGAERLYGRSAAEALGRYAVEITATANPGVVPENMARVGRGETIGPFDTVHHHRSGRALEVSVTLSPIRDSGGVVTGVASVTRDVAKRRGDERALRASEERYRMVARATREVIWDSDLLTGELRWDGAAQAMFGYSLPQEVAGDVWWEERIHPEDTRRVISGIRAVLQSDRDVWSDEYRFRRADGAYATVVDRCYAVRDEGGRAVRVIGSMMDVTERRKAETALRASEERYRTLVEQIPAAVYIDAIASGGALYRSPQYEALTGYPVEEIMADPDHWSRTLHPDDRGRVLAEHRRTGETGEPFRVEYRQISKDGRTVWVRDEAVLVRDEEGEPLYWQGVASDITERKRAEEEVREANRRMNELAVLKADFTAMVAHELDTPLAVIRGYADMISTGALDDESLRRALARIQSETDVLDALVEDVRTAASVEREDFAVDPCPVSVVELLGDAAAFAGSLPGDRGSTVRNNVSGAAVQADRYRIGQVLRNLLSNAARYSPRDAPIGLAALPGDEPGCVRFEVSDRGIGISPEDASRIFEKFGRGRGGRNQTGLGLGLYLSRRILQAHGGDLSFRPGPAGGSTFSFELEGVV